MDRPAWPQPRPTSQPDRWPPSLLVRWLVVVLVLAAVAIAAVVFIDGDPTNDYHVIQELNEGPSH
jgi:hypothetical protein